MGTTRHFHLVLWRPRSKSVYYHIENELEADARVATFIEQLTQGKSPPRVDVLAEDNEEDDAGEEDANNE
jgi:hypothetical protein